MVGAAVGRGLDVGVVVVLVAVDDGAVEAVGGQGAVARRGAEGVVVERVDAREADAGGAEGYSSEEDNGGKKGARHGGGSRVHV